MMEFIETTLKDAYIVIPNFSTDNRGAFLKDFHKTTFLEKGIDFELKEEMMTVSKRGVIRGMHFQLYKPQAKLVRCLKGKVYDYIVDLRQDSPTFLKGEGFILDDIRHHSLYVPKGFAHGYLVLEDSLVLYRCDEEFFKDGDASIKYDDETLNINWHPEYVDNQAFILSEKDANAKSFKYYEPLLNHII